MLRSAGVDIGTTFITVYENFSRTVSRFRHEGKIAETLRRILVEFDDDDQLIFTGKSGKETAQRMNAVYIEEAVALSYMLSENDPFGGENGKVIDIGASSLTLYTINGGRVTDIAENTLCAAGTGLFLEEQAERLGIDLETRGTLAVEDPPSIASRCTVFARSDLIHHQQEGRTKDEMWSGLCRSLAVSAVNTLFRGEELKGKILLCGGVSLNKEVIKWFNNLYPLAEWIFPDQGEAYIAAGASTAEGKPKGELNTVVYRRDKEFDRMPPLTLKRSRYPRMTGAKVDEQGNEIRIHRGSGSTGQLFDGVESVILGMDIGSTSTKLAVLDAETLKPLLDIYGKTAGDPIGAARKVFSSFYSLTSGDCREKVEQASLFPTSLISHSPGGARIRNDRPDIPIRAFGTTGSGRYLVGKIFGADFIVNEISAHARGTLHFFPDVETIFEIGGQDAKFIRLRDGFAADVNMNYVCAAGTGTFVEEQARKLGFDIGEVGDITEGIAPPVTSDRCTVFMEQDLRALLREGFSREEALASVLYSVIRNYLTRVVGNRRVSERKIFFQGATARNRGLVAALENLLNVEVVVSPFCHVMGSIGAALMAQEARTPGTVSGFPGRKAAGLEVSTRTGRCELCRNLCRINYISRGGGPEFSWGYQCGRDPEEKVRKEIIQYGLFKQRENAFRAADRENRIPGIFKGTVTIINALTSFTFYPLWKRFFNLLGYRVRLSGQTDSTVKKYATAIASADFCFPVKVALGHVVHALQRPDPIFLPYMIADKRIVKTAHSFFCPYMESSASFVRSTLNRNNIETGNLLSPVVDLRRPVKETSVDIYETLKEKLEVKKKEVTTAFIKAYNEWETFTSGLERAGTELLEKLKDTPEPVFILIGRPYNLHDHGLNLGIPEKIASMGYTVIPIDMLELGPEIEALAGGNYHNVFWKYGQRIIAALKKIGGTRNIFPIYFSNFNCGPDSFLLSYAEEETKGKPMLVLELDEHDSDGGYLTRIEAFLDVVHAYMKRDRETLVKPMPPVFTAARRPDLRGTVWIPPMHPSGYRLFGAAFRAFGYDSEVLPMEDGEAFALGKKYLNGGECLPMTLTLGAFLKMVKNRAGNGRHILFMPTTEGPCRFGQYNLAERIVFHNLGLDNVEIFSPSSMNSYQGLGDEHRRLLMHAMVSGDVLFKMLTKIRPYERTWGDADSLFEKSLRQMEGVLEKKGNLADVVKKVASEYASIAIHPGKKPLVGIVGEIYVRCNPSANGGLVEVIEANGGEAWLAPMHEWILYVAYMQSAFERARSFNLVKKGEAMLTNLFFHKIEETYYNAAAEVLNDRREPPIKEVVADGAGYLPVDFVGEAILTVGRAVQFARNGASMVVNAAPFGCMPGTLSSSILLEIKEKFNIPFVSLFYDGDIDVNDKVASLLDTITIEKERKNGEQTVEGIEPLEYVEGGHWVSRHTLGV